MEICKLRDSTFNYVNCMDNILCGFQRLLRFSVIVYFLFDNGLTFAVKLYLLFDNIY